jgi:hypothetical protein
MSMPGSTARLGAPRYVRRRPTNRTRSRAADACTPEAPLTTVVAGRDSFTRTRTVLPSRFASARATMLCPAKSGGLCAASNCFIPYTWSSAAVASRCDGVCLSGGWMQDQSPVSMVVATATCGSARAASWAWRTSADGSGLDAPPYWIYSSPGPLSLHFREEEIPAKSAKLGSGLYRYVLP